MNAQTMGTTSSVFWALLISAQPTALFFHYSIFSVVVAVEVRKKTRKSSTREQYGNEWGWKMTRRKRSFSTFL
jgi:hypothetical protein